MPARELTLVTPEPAPLAVFGEAVSRDVAIMLSQAQIAVETQARAKLSHPNRLELRPTGDHLEVDRVVTVPVLDGQRITGLPCDETGFLPVDRHGRVARTPGVYGAGDVANVAIKQGGIACQQADAAAETIAAAAGAEIEPAPFEPVLRGLLRTQRDSLWMERHLEHGNGSKAFDGPRTKFAGRELSRLLLDVTSDAS